MNKVRRLLTISLAVMTAAVSTGCGASGASIFMKDGSVVNIGDTNPQVQTENAGVNGPVSDAGPGTGEGETVGSDGASTGQTGTPHYTYEGEYDMWQYTSAGTVDGIGTLVDFDLSYVDFGQ